MQYLEAIQDAIKKTHGCESTHKESVSINEIFHGENIWQGAVEVFELQGHAEAEVCYAWGQHIEGQKEKSRYVAVLKIPPVDSPVAAVRASIVADSKNAP